MTYLARRQRMWVRVNGVRLFFDVEGAGLVSDGPRMRERPTMVLLHGGPGFDHSLYKPAFSALTDVAQIVFLDHRGNGRSEAGPPEAWTLAQWGDAGERAMAVIRNSSGRKATMGDSRIARGFVRFAPLALAVLLLIARAAAADETGDAWAALAKGGHVVLIRHGNAPPGQGGDPPGFKLNDCSTQRNLDELGREEARALGVAFRKHGVRVDRTLSSPWCRCLETARLMAVGEVESTWALVPDTNPSSKPRLSELKTLVSEWKGPGTLVLVTHALTIRPLVGFLPLQAEAVVVKPTTDGAGYTLVGRIAPPQ